MAPAGHAVQGATGNKLGISAVTPVSRRGDRQDGLIGAPYAVDKTVKAA
jgi:hypothetical protein